MDEKLAARLERVAPLARRFFAPTAGRSARGAQESTGGGKRTGPPDSADAKAIARKILSVPMPAVATVAGRDPQSEAEGIAAQLVARADAMLQALGSGASDAAVSADGAVALEAVLHVRGRPALKVYGDELEELDRDAHPGSGFWHKFFEQHEKELARVASAAGAVVVKDRYGTPPWVQGTAWLIKPDLVVTNRHVLLPPLGMRLVRRAAGATTKARFKDDLDVSIDFAFDAGPARERACRVIDVPYISEEADPVDVAVIRIRRPDRLTAALPDPLIIASDDQDFSYLYVVGHPGKMDSIPPPVLAVFGTPDERKRVSFGETMELDSARPIEIIHDASTIGGYSGGCVLSFLKAQVAGLHYYGDPLTGNRAFTAEALREHEVAKFF